MVNVMQVKELLIRQSTNDKVAFRCGSEKITFRQWYEASVEISEEIANKHSYNALNCALFFPNGIEYVKAYFGVLFADKVIVPIGTKSKPLEIISTVKYHEVDIILSTSENAEFLETVFAEYDYRVAIFLCDKKVWIEVNPQNPVIEKTNFIQQKGDDSDVAIMLHTSGTTSDPKRVMLTNKNLIENIKSNIESLQLTEDNKVLIALPMHFGYCNTAQYLTQLYLGASCYIMDSLFLPKTFFKIVAEEKITMFTAVPSMLLMILDYRYSDRYDFSSLRYVCFGGGKMPIDKLRKLIEKFPTVGFVQTYGQTECSPRVTALLPEYSLKKIGSVGKTIPRVTVKVVDSEDREVLPNEIGEIVVQGPNIMRGYYKKQEATDNVIRNGWLHTGDLGRFDEDGFLYITGRIKNMIISGGINIYPEEIEQIILQHDDVEDVCVYGEENDMLGEIPVAKVVLKKEVSPVDLKRYCAQYLTDYKIPHRFEIVESLPKTYNGKVKRY